MKILLVHTITRESISNCTTVRVVTHTNNKPSIQTFRFAHHLPVQYHCATVRLFRCRCRRRRCTRRHLLRRRRLIVTSIRRSITLRRIRSWCRRRRRRLRRCRQTIQHTVLLVTAVDCIGRGQRCNICCFPIDGWRCCWRRRRRRIAGAIQEDSGGPVFRCRHRGVDGARDAVVVHLRCDDWLFLARVAAHCCVCVCERVSVSLLVCLNKCVYTRGYFTISIETL